MQVKLCKGFWRVAAIALFALSGTQIGWAQTKNIILMIGDGAGFQCWHVASMYQGRWDAAQRRSTQVYDGPGWLPLACSTHPLNTSPRPTGLGVQDPQVVYDPAKAWSGAAATTWLKAAYTDSAAAATALATGQKTYDKAINWSDWDEVIWPTITELAKARGKSVGIITSVQWSHATPAGLSHARSRDRDDYESIANQMLTGDVLDVIMGCGNPDYDDNGQSRLKKKEYKYVGGEPTWRAMEAARATPNGRYRGFRPVSTKAEFEALARGPTPQRVLGTAQVAQTLQQVRTAGNPHDPAHDAPLNESVPTLATMTRGALNVLDDNPQGLFLMVEGGAIDWANHNNQPGRMIQEQSGFFEAIEAVVQWVESHSNWQDTLLILTADHETGLLWGPKSDTEPFDPLLDHGQGQLPGLRYNSKSHTNSLVPLFVKGAGSEHFASLVVGVDPVRGSYVTNTAVFEVMHRSMLMRSVASEH
ncbi:MAG: alkaline phosphatase [Planctomycetota bacterium]|nr:alkaline phosphatase [Planctomycetota bacterium]